MFFQHKTGIRLLAIVVLLVLGGTVFMMRSCLAEKSEKPVAAAAAKDAESDVVESDWTLRCMDSKGKQLDSKKGDAKCEVYKTLGVNKSRTRVAEFAVGFPDPKKPDEARGAVVLPLGVMLDQDVAMKIDDNKPFSFKLLYCTNLGCFSLINVNKDLLDQMQEGKAVHFLFRAMNGQNVDLSLGLSGFSKALKQAQ